MRVDSLRSSWWDPLPLPMISTPLRLIAMWGADGVNSSSHVSLPTSLCQEGTRKGGKGGQQKGDDTPDCSMEAHRLVGALLKETEAPEGDTTVLFI